ncbi:Alpha/Beta hydrolase protein [Cladochytrium replicatum]|nr:Alpha/Beta hydrolase protein [Cladochytrium replicatum]
MWWRKPATLSAVTPSDQQSFTFSYKSVDGDPISATFFPAPESDTKTPRPLLVFAHAGGMVVGGRSDFPPQWLGYAGQSGWHFLTFSYQLLPPGNASTLIADVKDLGNWIGSSLNTLLVPHDQSVDLSRIIVSGQSAGGYIAYQCGRLFPPEVRPRAVLSFVGSACDWGPGSSSTWYTHPKPDGYQFRPNEPPITSFTEDMFTELLAGAVSHVSDIPFSSSPQVQLRSSYYRYLIATGTYAEKFGIEDGPVIPHMDASFPKTAIVHGNKDTLTPIEEAKAVFERLNGYGVEVKLFEIEGGDHDSDPGGPKVLEAFDLIHEWLK